MKIYIGAENIVSPLGTTAFENFTALKENKSGISLFKEAGFNNEDLYLSRINKNEKSDFYTLLNQSFKDAIASINPSIVDSERTLVIISTTKADINHLSEGSIHSPVQKLQQEHQLFHYPLVISNACISGVLALNTAANYIRAGHFDHVIVTGCDVVSDFVLFGFQSLFAISNEACKPFDAERKGITLGEGAATIVLSNNKALFKYYPLKYLSGSSSNDANHISGPSRTGEGLFRTINKTIEKSGLSLKDIHFISAHGTGTNYNDEMESIAFDRLGLNEVPLNSMKGYYGHTLGAAGMIESVISMQSMRNNYLIKSMGFEEKGTSGDLNIITQNRDQEINTVLKTASGFGGCNASALFTK